MAYAHLKDEARTEDRLIRSFGHEPEAEAILDSELGFIWTELDEDEGWASQEELFAALEYWNERL